MKTSRRVFLKSSGLALAAVGVAPAVGPAFLRNLVFAAEPQRARQTTGGRKILICIFQRGAVDGLSMVVPHGDPQYYKHRTPANGGIALARIGEGAVLDLDGMFGLHPALSKLKPIYDAGHLTAIQACGSPHATRSHFDAQDYMEAGAPGNKTIRDGWLARTLQNCPEDAAKAKKVIRSVSLTARAPRSLQGNTEVLSIADLSTFDVGKKGSGTADGFEALYDEAAGDVLHGVGKETFEALKQLRDLNPAGYVPAPGAQYPPGRFGTALRQLAQLIKADIGLEVGFAESGGWGTHINQGGAKGRIAQQLQEFGGALAAFYTDLGDRMADVTILTMSEFGRTVRPNGNGGTDHGHGTCFLALGGNVKGGRVLGQWPGLAPEQLYENRDLPVTTDFRDVFGEIAQRHLGVRDLKAVFPAYDSSPAKFRGVLR